MRETLLKESECFMVLSQDLEMINDLAGVLYLEMLIRDIHLLR